MTASFPPFEKVDTVFELYVLSIGQMQIFLRGRSTYAVDVEKTDTILHIKKLIFEKEQIPARFLLLTAGTRCLDENKTLADYGISREATIYFRVRAVTLESVLNPCLDE